MKRSLLTFVFLSLFLSSVSGQAGVSIEKMRQERAEMEQQIARQEKILLSTENDITHQVANLNIIAAKLKARTRLLDQTRNEIRQLDRQGAAIQVEIGKLEKEYEECSDSYAQACRFYQNQNSNFNSLTFILSSETFRQMGRRVRYVREYSGSLRDLAQELSQKKDTLEQRRAEVEKLKNEKVSLQKEQQASEEAARLEQQEQQKIVDGLKSRRSSLKKEIKSKQTQMDKLSKEIDRQIQLAIEEERAKQKSQSSSKPSRNDAADVRLSGSFENNKGRLPMPLTGNYLVVGEYGVQNVAGMKDVRQNNLGLDIQGESGAEACAVFDGEVSRIFQQGKGQIGVLIRHGAYISVYCNLSETRLKSGDKVKTGDRIGPVQISENGSPVLHFQLHKENTRLNPSDWLRR
ncbi:MAG: peptidoglycan DD-metalloendopeptidase family protein [Bacteroidaceae bacterium]|nr:peptidoglycan DD-metalloendopeptidase family protein [Bacteroidaceae bacterium]